LPGFEEAYQLALGAQARKERTVAELAAWLGARGVGEGETAEVVERLVVDEVLDDARFAQRYAEDKRELAGWGTERIRAALLERGVDRADVEVALSDPDGPSELDRATDLLRGGGRSLRSAPERQRALGFLVRRGYDSEVAYEAIRRVAGAPE
jgi:regulatory protein